MKRFLTIGVVICVLAVFYSVLSDPSRREGLLDTIEGSTGVNLETDPDGIFENAGKALGRSSGRAFKSLGDTLTDPEFHRALKRMGQGAVEKLEEVDIEALKDEIHSSRGEKDLDYEAILRKYLGNIP